MAIGERETTRALTWISYVTALWGLCYAAYRAYYAAGGTWLLPGTIEPGSVGQFRLINGAAVVVLLVAAGLPLAMLPLWRRGVLRRTLLVLCWLVAVGCCMHALIDMTQRVLSLTGHLRVTYPAMWQSVDRRSADLQDLFGNEPWFLIEGLLFGAIAWCEPHGVGRRWWLGTAIAATAVLVAYGMLAATGVVGRSVVF